MEDTLGRDYTSLALRIERHVEGFIDGYFGPPELQAAIAAEKLRPLETLRDDAARLQEQIANAVMDAQRRDFLTRQVRAMEAVVRRQLGEALSYLDEVEACFDIRPERTPEAEFEAGLAALDALYPGEGDLFERRLAWSRQLELPVERVLPAVELALGEARRRTAAFLTLPADEAVEVHLVNDQPWSGYNWYLGRNRSRIDINTDLPVRIDSLLNLMAHEAYPGHHTEHVLKEQRWYREAGRLEHSLLLLLAPESFIAEAIATVAQDVIFPDPAELADWLREALYPAAGVTVDVALQAQLTAAGQKLAGVSGNAALLLHEDGLPEEDVVAYIQRYGLRSEKEARQTLRFITHPLFRPYVFNYFYGRKLLLRAFESAPREEVFRWVVSEPVTPSAIVTRYGLA